MYQNNKNSFEQFIIKCCKANEWDLRKFLKKKLERAGFIIKEDDYIPDRAEKNNKYNKVHNLLAIRGNPRVCLVAHTDVCRDHWSYDSASVVNPVIKNWGDDENPKFIIQDETCETQVGGDDRLGVAINTWIALNTGYDIGLLFTTDEELGLVSAGKCEFEELKTFDLLIQTDRGNPSNQIVNKIGVTKLCSDIVANRLLKIAKDINLPRELTNGLITDVAALKSRNICNDAVNLTIGYQCGHSNSEYIEIKKAKEAMRYVSEIIQYYDIKLDNENNNELNKDNSIKKIEIDNIENYIFSTSKKEKRYKNHKKYNKKRKYLH